MPTYEQVAALPAFCEQPVPAPFEDINGHLNVRHYLGIASEGLDESLEDLGIPQNWPQLAKRAMFSAEHHLTYLSELRSGDRISVRVRLVGRSAKGVHALAFLLDETHKKVSYVMEEIFLCVDMDTRKTTAWPEDVAAGLDERVAQHRKLAWDAPTSGSLALR